MLLTLAIASSDPNRPLSKSITISLIHQKLQLANKFALTDPWKPDYETGARNISDDHQAEFQDDRDDSTCLPGTAGEFRSYVII
jgi:hypothetical protein